jgi:hypothetical protein
MTQFESDVFDFVEEYFGRDAAIKNYCFWIKAIAALGYMGYICMLPVEFVKLFYNNLKEKGVI